MGVGSAIIAVGAFVNEFHHQGVGPELPIMRMTTECQVYSIHDGFGEMQGLMIQDDQGLTGIHPFEEAMQAPAFTVDQVIPPN